MKDTPESEIRGLIEAKGSICFAEFMRVALCHPMGGYYMSARAIGAAGDYFTSPAAHPVFGALIAVQLHRMWQLLDSPSAFDVIEMGAGDGLLAAEVAGYSPGRCATCASIGVWRGRRRRTRRSSPTGWQPLAYRSGRPLAASSPTSSWTPSPSTVSAWKAGLSKSCSSRLTSMMNSPRRWGNRVRRCWSNAAGNLGSSLATDSRAR